MQRVSQLGTGLDSTPTTVSLGTVVVSGASAKVISWGRYLTSTYTEPI